jgi:hypothetical protein
VGTVPISVTGGWQTWQTQTGTAFGGGGLHNLYLVFTGGTGIGNLNWFQFSGALPPLPIPWITTDFGAVGLAGGASCSNGTFTVNGSGDDIWNGADAFRFVQQPVHAACELRARVVNLQNTDPWAKAGVMFRESAAAGSINAAVVVTPSNGVAFQVRTNTGAASTSIVVGGVTAPCWVRLVRSTSNSFAGYYSLNGTNWTQIGSGASLSMSNNASAGMVVSAHNNAASCVATFDNVTVNQAPVLAAVPNQTILAGRVLTVTNFASDADIPTQLLRFSLLNPPAGSTVKTNTGLFTWRPAISQSPATQAVMVVVSDVGVPAMSATQSFTVRVSGPTYPVLDAPATTNGQWGFWIRGDAGPDYTIQVSTNLMSWSAIATGAPASLPWFWTDTNSAVFPSRFYRALLGP